MNKILLSLLISTLLFTGNVFAEEALPDPDATPVSTARDPLEPYNRVMHRVNKNLDRFIFKPIARGYKFILPRVIRNRVTNFYTNIGEIPVFANGVLQADPESFFTAFWRFAINSTVGIFGLFDPASNVELYHRHQDLGLTFAKWGYKNSTYFVIPVFGPSTIRDTIALPINYYLFTIYPHISDDTVRYGMIALYAINRRAGLLEIESALEKAALDPYVFERNAYLQRRNFLIARNANGAETQLLEDEEWEIGY